MTRAPPCVCSWSRAPSRAPWSGWKAWPSWSRPGPLPRHPGDPGLRRRFWGGPLRRYYQRQGVEVRPARSTGWPGAGPPLPLLARPGERRGPDRPAVAPGALDPASGTGRPVLGTPALPAQPGPGRRQLARRGDRDHREVHQARLLRQLEGIEMAWCASDADANLLAGLRPGLAVTRLGPPLFRPGPGKGFADREGVALVATDSFDAAGDPEAPALRALEGLCRPAPAGHEPEGDGRERLAHSRPGYMATAVGAEIVPSRGDLVGALRTARLGSGARCPRDQCLRRGCRPCWRRGRPGCARPRRWRGPTWRGVDEGGRRGRCRHHGPPGDGRC